MTTLRPTDSAADQI